MFHDISLIVTNISPISSQWHETYGKPVMVSEYGGDTVAGLHSLPSLMFTEEWQVGGGGCLHSVSDHPNLGGHAQAVLGSV